MRYPFLLKKLLVRSGIAQRLPVVRRLLDDSGLWLRHYSDRILAAPHAALADAAALLTPTDADAIDLASGSPAFDLVPSGSTKLPVSRRGFPPVGGLAELRAAVADRMRAEHGLCVDAGDEVLITPGATGALATVLDTFMDPGDRAILFDPASPLYSLALASRRARVQWLHTWVDQGRLRFHVSDLARMLRGARLLFLNSPSNPTGAAIAAEDLEQIAWWAERRDVLVVCDEAYDRFWYRDKIATMATYPGAAQRTLTIGSISKGYALSAARVGWLTGHRHLMRACGIGAATSPFVPTLEQQIALTALRQSSEAFDPVLAEFDSRRRYACERLRAIGFPVSLPAGGFFYWLPVGALGMTGRQVAERLLATHGVRILPGDIFGPSGRAYVRLSYAGEDGRLQEGLARLSAFVGEALAAPARRAA